MVRPLTEDDSEAMRHHFREAFGAHDEPDPPVPMHRPGKNWWGIEVDGRLVATALDRECESWFDGARVPTSGIGGVAVAPEHRGAGLLTPLIEHVLTTARERGAVISTLYATSPGLYRRFGFESVGSLDVVRLPPHALQVGGARPVRRATAADADQVRDAHERWAERRRGPLSHRGPMFTEDPTLRVDGVTVSEHLDGSVSGYASWDRGRGYGADGRLVVHQLVADDADSYRSLLSMLGSFASVVAAVDITTSGVAPWRGLVRTDHAVTTSSRPYSLAVLDPVALTFLEPPPRSAASLPFRVGDHGLRLEVADGAVSLHEHAGTARELTRGGLALTFSGAASSATLREIGHLSGPADDDPAWDALFQRGPVVVADYF